MQIRKEQEEEERRAMWRPFRVKKKLKTIQDVVQFQSAVIRAAMTKKLGGHEAANLCNMASKLRESMEVGDLESKIFDLEQRLKEAQEGQEST